MNDPQTADKKPISDIAAEPEIRTAAVLCPIAGKLALDRSGTADRGCAIKPYEGHLYAPFSGKVTELSDLRNSLRLVSDDGVELLIRIGWDAAEPDGKYFSAYCKAGDSVKEGDLLIDFDLDAIGKEGYDTVTWVNVTNSERYGSIDIAADGKTRVGDKLLNLIGKSINADQKINENEKPD